MARHAGAVPLREPDLTLSTSYEELLDRDDVAAIHPSLAPCRETDQLVDAVREHAARVPESAAS